jgi:SAM-dependent methyltransferase
MNVRGKIYRHQPFEYPAQPPLPFDGFGWNSTERIFETLIRRLKPSVILEVGSWYGASAIHMARLALNQRGPLDPPVEVIAIDTFLGSVYMWQNAEFDKHRVNGRIDVYPQFLSNVIWTGLTNTITPLPLDSVNAAYLLGQAGVVADLIYIDGGHEYEHVMQDIACYKDLLRPGGVLLGDDANFPDVHRAAVDSIPGFEIHDRKFVWTKA